MFVALDRWDQVEAHEISDTFALDIRSSPAQPLQVVAPCTRIQAGVVVSANSSQTRTSSLIGSKSSVHGGAHVRYATEHVADRRLTASRELPF